MLWTKRAHQSTIFQTFECSNQNSPNFLCHFWNHKVRVYLNFASLFSVMKDNSSVFFFSSNLICFGQKEPIEVKFSDFRVDGWKFTKFLKSYLKPQVSFYLKFTSLFSVTRELFCTFLAETLYDLDKRNPSNCKISEFRLLTWNFTKLVLWQVPFVDDV